MGSLFHMGMTVMPSVQRRCSDGASFVAVSPFSMAFLSSTSRLCLVGSLLRDALCGPSQCATTLLLTLDGPLRFF